MEATNLFREIGLEVAHEPGHLLNRIRRCQKMKVVGHHHNRMHPQAAQRLRLGEYPDRQAIAPVTRTQEKTPLESPLSDLNQTT
jgi:hypothetical protein